MKALIPVAGFGKRLRPHTLVHPKVLLPVAGKPMLEHIIDQLIQDGIDDIIFIVGHLGENIEAHLKKRYNKSFQFVRQEKPLGLGHAIHSARGAVEPGEPLMIVLGDTLYDADLKTVSQGPHTSLGIKEVENPRRFGVAVLDEHGFISKLVEKPQEQVSKLALVGIYYIKNSTTLFDALQEIIDKNIKTKNEYQLTDGLQLMIDKGETMTVFNVEGWYDCGKIETILETNRILLEKQTTSPPAYACNSIIIPPCFIHPEAKIYSSIIGPNVSVSKETVIEKSILEHTIIGENSEIKFTHITHSLIGNNVKLKGKFNRITLGDFSEHEM